MELIRFKPYSFKWDQIRDEVISEFSEDKVSSITISDLIEFLDQFPGQIEENDSLLMTSVLINGIEHRYDSSNPVIKSLITFIVRAFIAKFEIHSDLTIYFLERDYLTGDTYSFNRFFIFNGTKSFPINFPIESAVDLSKYLEEKDDRDYIPRSILQEKWLTDVFAYREYYSLNKNTERERLNLLRYINLDQETLIHSNDIYRDCLIKEQTMMIRRVYSLLEYALIGFFVIILILGYIAYKS